MICDKIDLYGDHRVMLYTYIQHWTTVPGHYPLRGGVLVLPGGAYRFHGVSEGEPVAAAYAAAGYNAYLLRYSIGEHAVFPAPVADACRALALIRTQAERWGQDPNQIALCGFSAGGHVAACCGTMWNRRDIMQASGTEGERGKPNALILGYPCITVDMSAQREMYSLLQGKMTESELIEAASAERWVGCHTPPVFLWNMFHDRLVPVEHGLLFMQALAEHDVPYENHTYMYGTHASALCTPVSSLGDPERENIHTARWFADSVEWLGQVFGVAKLDVPQENMQPIGTGRAHMGIPSFRMPDQTKT